MATRIYSPPITQGSSSQRPMAMVLALVLAVMLSPLYTKGDKDVWPPDTAWSSGPVLPVILAGLIYSRHLDSLFLTFVLSFFDEVKLVTPVFGSFLGAQKWEFILGAWWDSDHVGDTALLATFRSRIAVEIGIRLERLSTA